jgi:DNA polymerase-4
MVRPQKRIIYHIDFNSYFATVEQQANPRLRGKPIGVTGGDRLERTVLGAVSIEAKAKGVKTGMTYADAKELCPDIILVRGDSDKYLECTKRFLNILKNISPTVEVFSIDEVFLEMPLNSFGLKPGQNPFSRSKQLFQLGEKIKNQIRQQVGQWVQCSIGISYNKRMSKFAGSMLKPDGLTIIADEIAAMRLLDQVDLDEICGIGLRTKRRLNSMGITTFDQLRRVPLVNLLASFKSYGKILYDMARGIDETIVQPFYDKEEVKSVGHRHTLSVDTADVVKIQQLFFKLAEMVARRLRAKKLSGRTVSIWYRAAFDKYYFDTTGQKFYGEGRQMTIMDSNDGFAFYKAAWNLFSQIWQGENIRMVGIAVSNVRPVEPENLSLLPDVNRNQIITHALDQINDRFGEFSLQRGILSGSYKMKRMPNPFLSDRRFKI